MNFEHNLNLLYDYLNNDISINKYKIDEININKINESDVELPEGKESNEILHQILNKSLQYLFNINNNIYFRILSDNISSIMKISIDNKTYNDNYFSYILSELVLLKKTNNILLPIINIKVKLSDISDLLHKIDNLPEILINLIEKNKKSLISISIREGFHNIVTLRNYINEYKVDYKKILCEIITALKQIKIKYKNFKHNNLNLDNIFVYIIKNKFILKITNFEKASIEENNINNDLNTLSKDILKENINLDLLTKNFLSKLIEMKNNNLENILNDSYFKKYNGSRNINLDDNKIVGGSKNKLSRNMVGGSDKPSILPMKAEKNNPFKSNDERLTASKRQEEIRPYVPPAPEYASKKPDYISSKKTDLNKPTDPNLVPIKHPVLMEQTIYDTSKLNQPPVNKQPMPPAYIPLYNTDGTQMGIPMTNMMYNPVYQEPMQKVYNISLSNPLHNFSTVTKVFEDVLPGDPRTFTFTTTFERTQIINFMRNLINDDGDGEPMDVTGGKNSLLSSLKLLDLNPYTLNKHPYKDLGSNFMIYRAMYPIRYDFDKNRINAAKGSHGINVRMYNIRLAELNGNKINSSINNLQFDLWRDLHYYNHIRNNILAKKISPNFISFILYKIDKLSNINWNELGKYQKKEKDKIEIELNRMAGIIKQKASYDEVEINGMAKLIRQTPDYSTDPIDNKLHVIFLNNNVTHSAFTDLTKDLTKYPNIVIKNLNPIETLYLNLTKKFNITTFPSIIFKYNNITIKYKGNNTSEDILKFLDSLLVNVLQDSGQSLILLTEAPNNNIIRWASPLYENKGSLRSMIATGYHKPEVWKSVLFQMMHILYILQKEEIYFEELSLENNFYIKDLYYDSNNLNYWIYNVNGLDYYVPNYGYLVLFDSKYSDLKSGEFKIRSPKLYPDLNDKKDNKNDTTLGLNYDDLIYKQAKDIFNPFNFNNKLKLLGGLEPDATILTLITDIHNYGPTSANNIQEMIRNFFAEYLNNRIGILLTKTEKENVNILNRPILNKEGQLLIKQERYDEFRWVLFESKAGNSLPQRVNIITKDDNTKKIINDTVNEFALINYPESVKPFNIEDRNIIENYKN